MGSDNTLHGSRRKAAADKWERSRVGVSEGMMEMKSRDEEVSALFLKPQNPNPTSHEHWMGECERGALWKPARISIFHVKGLLNSLVILSHLLMFRSWHQNA